MNIPKTLDTIKTTDNVKAQVNLLTGLTVLFRTKVTRDMLVTSSIIYETAHSILSQGVGDESVRVLTFLTALLEESGETASRARELLRLSGCLQDMTSMFLGTMKVVRLNFISDEETWKILCECLTKSCKECMDNQNYCSRLIPTCIQRCKVRNSDIIKVLHSLLLHNARNIQIFVDSSGLSIFTRETLQDRPTMELLATVVQNSAAAHLLQQYTQVMEFLYTFEDCSQEHLMVELASFILFKISSTIEGVEMMGDSTEIHLKLMETGATESTTTSSSDFTVSFLYKDNWDKVQNILDHAVNKDIKITDPMAASDKQISFHLGSIDLLTFNTFTPKCISTPKITRKTATERKSSERLHISNNAHSARANNTEPVIKQTSTSASLFNFVKKYFASVFKTVQKCSYNNTVCARSQKHITKGNLKNDNSVSGQKLRRIKHINKHKKLRNIVRLLKAGMYIYGCNFKKISQVIWPQEKKMTPQVLYCIYRKYIIKRVRDVPAFTYSK